MKFSEDSSEAAKFLKLAVPKMVQHGIVPNPLNYTLWYSYFSNSSPSLNTALDSAVKRYGTCPTDIGEALFLEHITEPDDNNQSVNKVQQALVHLVTDLSCNINETVNQTSLFSTALKENLLDLNKSELCDELADKINDLSANANGICSINEVFQSQLESAQSEIDTLKRELEESKIQATTDTLTGLNNRRVLESIYNEYTNSETDVSIVMMDIDEFKLFNDTHGHVMGDQILQFVGKLLKQECPINITPIRFGGEEFAILCSETPLEHVAKIAENIRQKLSNVSFSNKRTGDKIEPVTASFGIAVKHTNELLDDLVERADNALYKAKTDGRNQVKIAG